MNHGEGGGIKSELSLSDFQRLGGGGGGGQGVINPAVSLPRPLLYCNNRQSHYLVRFFFYIYNLCGLVWLGEEPVPESGGPLGRVQSVLAGGFSLHLLLPGGTSPLQEAGRGCRCN